MSAARGDFDRLSGCDPEVNGKTSCGQKLYPDATKPALVCSVTPLLEDQFFGSWSIFEPSETGDGNTFAMIEVATFKPHSFVLKRSGFLGLVDSASRRTELWPPSPFTGVVMCTVGRVVLSMCVLPPPSLIWNLHPTTGFMTVDRVPIHPHPFGSEYCRTIGADIGAPRYTRTFWSLDDRGVVAVAERRPDNVLFRWAAKVPAGTSVNTTTLGLTFPARSEASVCVTAIVGAGENILSLAAKECRVVTFPDAITFKDRPTCDCHLQRFLGAVCSMLIITLFSTLAYMYLHREPAPDRLVFLHIQYVRNGSEVRCEIHPDRQAWQPPVPAHGAPPHVS